MYYLSSLFSKISIIILNNTFPYCNIDLEKLKPKANKRIMTNDTKLNKREKYFSKLYIK